MRMNNGGTRYQEHLFCIQENSLFLVQFMVWETSQITFFFIQKFCPFLEITYDDIIQVQLGKTENLQLKSGFSSIFISPRSHSYFLETLSLVTQSNLIPYYISSTKSI